MMPLDKTAHILAGAAITLALGYVTTVLIAFVVAVFLGFCKEFYDASRPQTHTSDVWDFVATGAGALAAACFVLAAQHQVLILY